MLYLKLYFRQKWREYHESDRRVCKKHSGFSGTGNYIQRCNKHSSGCGGVTSGNRSDAGKLKDVEFDVVVGPESRGFIFGVPIAYNLHKPFIPIRKKGKLPCETVSVEYELEYGTATIEMHKDAIKPGQRVVIIDDLIATGGTNEAMVKLIEGLGGKVVKTVFLMELAGLKGRERLEGYDVDAVITYPGK